MKKKLSNIFHWLINGLLIGGLLAFIIRFFMMGDTFHGVLDLLYMLIIVANLFYRQQYEKMKREHQTATEASIELIKQNANLTKKLQAINDPFKPSPSINSIVCNVQVVRHAVRYETNFLSGYDELERNRRLYSLEVEARHGLMGDIIDTDLITIRHEDGDIVESVKFCVAEIYVGVKGGKDINEVINSSGCK